MKAQSQLLSHMIYVVLGFAAITLIFFSLTNLSSDVKKASIEIQSGYIAEAIKSEIMRLYSASEDSNFIPDQSAVLGKYELSLPERIAQEKYTVYLSQDMISVRTSGLEVNRSINIDVKLKGFSTLPAHLELSRENQNGVPVDTISLVGE